jgi:outer membrane protein insertion porin family
VQIKKQQMRLSPFFFGLLITATTASLSIPVKAEIVREQSANSSIDRRSIAQIPNDTDINPPSEVPSVQPISPVDNQPPIVPDTQQTPPPEKPPGTPEVPPTEPTDDIPPETPEVPLTEPTDDIPPETPEVPPTEPTDDIPPETPEVPPTEIEITPTSPTNNQPTDTQEDRLNIPIDGGSPETPTTPPTDDRPTNLPETPTTPPTDDSTIETPNTTTPANEPRVLVSEVQVVGVEGELKDLVYRSIVTQPGRTTTRTQLTEDVNAIYKTGLFGNVSVLPEDTPLGVRITYTVVANPVLKEVVIQTIPDDSEVKKVITPEAVQEIFSPQYGQIINLNNLKEDIKVLEKWYSDRGYVLAQVIDESIKIASDGTVTLTVAEGAIEKLQVRYFDDKNEPVEGNTREFIITREIELKAGDIFNRNTAQKDLQRVFGLGLFQDARFSFSPGEDPSKVVVNVDVVEGNSGSLAAGAGFSSSSGFFGTVSYQEQNLGGNNQTLGGEIQVGTREILYDARFNDPWIGGDDNRLSYSVEFFRRRSISLVFEGDGEDINTANGNDNPRVVRLGGGITFSRPIADSVFDKPDWRVSAGFEYQHVSVENDDGDLAPISRISDGGQLLAFSDDGSDDLFTFKFGATKDDRNNPLQPTSGSLLRLGLDQTVPIGGGNILLTRLRGSYSYYLPVEFINFSEGPQALAFNVQAGTILGDLPPYEAFILGGSNSVRGFAEGEVGSGRSYLQFTAEYRFPVISVVGGALFFDYGTTLGSGDDVPGDPAGRRGLPGDGYGYGVGVRIQSPLGPIRIDYAINEEGDNRIHFGIGERF